jgi:hypothetical protein
MSMITLTGGRVNYATIHDTQFVEFNGPDFHIFAGFGGTGDFPRTLNNGLERRSPSCTAAPGAQGFCQLVR